MKKIFIYVHKTRKETNKNNQTREILFKTQKNAKENIFSKVMSVYKTSFAFESIKQQTRLIIQVN